MVTKHCLFRRLSDAIEDLTDNKSLRKALGMAIYSSHEFARMSLNEGENALPYFYKILLADQQSPYNNAFIFSKHQLSLVTRTGSKFIATSVSSKKSIASSPACGGRSQKYRHIVSLPTYLPDSSVTPR